MSIAVVTGAGGGIGRATVAVLLAEGWAVHALDREAPEFASNAVTSHACDVTDESELSRIAAEIGQIDAIITAAGINLRPRDASVRHLEQSAWDATLAVNLTGTMLTVRAFFENLSEGGAITTLGSTAGLAGTPGADAYTATKGAVIALSRSWASEFSRFRIRVNCVCPGVTDTGMMDTVVGAIESEKMLSLPQDRFARPEEVAAVIAFSVNPKASYLSGAIIPVDGGATAHLAGMPFPRVRPKQRES